MCNGWWSLSQRASRKLPAWRASLLAPLLAVWCSSIRAPSISLALALSVIMMWSSGVWAIHHTQPRAQASNNRWLIIGGILQVGAVPEPLLLPHQAFALGVGEANQVNNPCAFWQIKTHGIPPGGGR